MKISELNTDEACNVLCAITPPVFNIVNDEEIREAFNMKLSKKDIATTGQQILYGTKIISSLIPLLLKTHKADIYEILAALNETTAEEIGKLNFLKTASLIREAVQDKDLITFFKSCTNGEQ